MKKLAILFLAVLISIAACADRGNEQTETKNTEVIQNGANEKAVADNSASQTPEPFTKSRPPNDVCMSLARYGQKLDKKQTFLIDFEPYKGGCFATFHEPEFVDPPLGEKYYVYMDGKEVFEFPEQNEAATFTVKAVAFDDLNGDDLTDLIVVGAAGAKFGDVYSNYVYTNTGQDFFTDPDANMKLDDFTKISEIKNFVKKNKNIYFP